ncbi:transglycosylase family protein [Streptomyces sp. NPDC005962]|uniref:transglycosylase family protein n=1 Tax=Streptomyces sp. NPDC005962 TaxID=3154466 RepID=UPI0033EA8C10
MLSGNGRHRRPRQAPAIVVAAGVTGASIAIPLFGATGAQAAPATTWDHVAECESAGMWSANEGNGFYGGLQLTLDMWKKYGGTGYAPRPDLASRSQQIAVAESILGDRGPDAWPSCALNAGLTGGGDAPDVNPGSTAPPSRQDAQRGDSGGSGDRGDSGERDGAPSGKTPDATDTPGASNTPGAPDASDAPEQPQDSASPDGPDGPDGDAPSPSPSSGASDPTPAPSSTEGGSGGPSGEHRGEQDQDERPSGHASRGGADRAENPTDGGYTVRPGDNLSAIAEKQESGGDWRRIYASNENLIGTDPDLIIPGQRLDLTIRGQ